MKVSETLQKIIYYIHYIFVNNHADKDNPLNWTKDSFSTWVCTKQGKYIAKQEERDAYIVAFINTETTPTVSATAAATATSGNSD